MSNVPNQVVVNAVTLSCENPVHLFLLDRLVTEHHYMLDLSAYSKKITALRTRFLKQKELADALICVLLSAEKQTLRARFSDFYAALFSSSFRVHLESAEKCGPYLLSYLPANECSVAEMLAEHYYQDWTLSVDKVAVVFRRYCQAAGLSAFDLDQDFIKRVAVTPVDGRRYKLEQLLPDHVEHSLLKAGVSLLQVEEDPLRARKAIKEDIVQCLDRYLYRYGHSFFGSLLSFVSSFFQHHRQRAQAVLRAIKNEERSLNQVQEMLENQKAILEGKEERPIESTLLSARWSERRNLSKTSRAESSVYYQEICKALQSFSHLKSF